MKRSWISYLKLTSTGFSWRTWHWPGQNLQVLDLSFNVIDGIPIQPPKSLNANAAFFDYNNIGPNVSDSWWNFGGSGSLVCFWVAGNSKVVASVLPASRPCSKLQPFHRLIPDPDSFVLYSKFWCCKVCKGTQTFYATDYCINESALCYCSDGYSGSGTNCTKCGIGRFRVRTRLECLACPLNSSSFSIVIYLGSCLPWWRMQSCHTPLRS